MDFLSLISKEPTVNELWAFSILIDGCKRNSILKIFLV